MFSSTRKSRWFSLAAFAAGSVCVMASASCRAGPPPVIPAVAEAVPAPGTYLLQSGARLHVSRDPRAEKVASYFVELLGRTKGIALTPVFGDAGGEDAAVVFELRAGATSAAEGYALDITQDRIRVAASEPSGLFYGAVTLWQLITATDAPPGAARLPGLAVRDEPRFPWRGFMLDSARHFVPVEFVKRLIDWMALHKLNVFHWHLTDDQGWRLQIRKYPRLTEIGAWRTPAGAAAGEGPYGGFYTQDEIRDIVRHASERFVRIVPEIEMPGHAQAAIAAYPWLGTGGAPRVSADWGVHDQLFNIEERTFAFLEDVLSEVIELFPGEYLHIGGDEAVKDRWIASPAVQRRMLELGVADEVALQAYFVARIERFVRGRGRTLIGWDEILDGGLPHHAAIMSWRSPERAIAAARAGHSVVMATHPTLYLDYLQSDAPGEPPGRPTYVTLADIYAFDPVPDGLSDAEASRLLGAQLHAWTEHMRTTARIEHQAFPRVAALAEVLWSPRAARNWRSFLERLPAQMRRYERLGVGFADSAFEPRFAVRPSGAGRASLELGNQVASGEIRYTLDGSDPGPESMLYVEPVEIDLPSRLAAATFMQGQRIAAVRSWEVSAATMRRRTDDDLETCASRLVLRLEDDAPRGAERATFEIDILEPCWIYRDADLTGISRVAAAVGQVPFNFQVGAAAQRIPLREPATPHGELEVRLSCGGKLIASIPLAAAAAHDGVTELPAARLQALNGRHDLCLTFTRAALEPMWAIEWIELRE